MKTKVYLAGKVNGAKHEVAKRISSVDFVCSDQDEHSEHGWGIGIWAFGNSANVEMVRQLALNQIDASDMVFAFLDTPDAFGSIAEIAYASTKLKPVVLAIVSDDAETVGDAVSERCQQMHDAYWFISAFPGVTVYSIAGVDEAAVAFQAFLDGYRARFLRAAGTRAAQ